MSLGGHGHRGLENISTQRALRDILMSRGKNCLPIVSRQFLTRNYPRRNRLLKCLPNCLSPTGKGIFSSFKITPAARVIARQLRDKNCLGAIFAPGHQDVSQGPLGKSSFRLVVSPNSVYRTIVSREHVPWSSERGEGLSRSSVVKVGKDLQAHLFYTVLGVNSQVTDN